MSKTSPTWPERRAGAIKAEALATVSDPHADETTVAQAMACLQERTYSGDLDLGGCPAELMVRMRALLLEYSDKP